MRKRNLGRRYDYILVEKEISAISGGKLIRGQSLVKKADILNDIFGSDHCPISCTISTEAMQKVLFKRRLVDY